MHRQKPLPPREGFPLRAVIFANGRLSHPELDRRQIQAGDWILAADGGVHNCLRLGLTPQVVVGDMDSLPPPELERLQAQGTQLLRFPSRKDQTDLELALDHALHQGAQEILILGALGMRWDQTLANMLLLTRPDLDGRRISLVDGPQRVYPLRAGQTLHLEGQPGDTLSLIPVQGDARGITTTGLEYALHGGQLAFGATRGISNTFLKAHVSIRLDQGTLLCIHLSRTETPKTPTGGTP